MRIWKQSMMSVMGTEEQMRTKGQMIKMEEKMWMTM